MTNLARLHYALRPVSNRQPSRDDVKFAATELEAVVRVLLPTEHADRTMLVARSSHLELERAANKQVN